MLTYADVCSINAVTSSGDVLELLVGFDNAEVILFGLDLQFLLQNNVRRYIVESVKWLSYSTSAPPPLSTTAATADVC